MTKSRAIFDTQRYRRSHMQEPRGRGGWLFENQAGEIVFQHNGTYGESKTAARAWAEAQLPARHIVLYTCP